MPLRELERNGAEKALEARDTTWALGLEQMRRALLLASVLAMGVILGCSKEMGDDRWYEPGELPATAWEQLGLRFVKHLISGDFATAHQMLGSKLRKSLTIEDLQSAMRQLKSEQFIKVDEPWVLSSIEQWPAKLADDFGMAYVQIGGDTNEAITVTVALENGEMKVRHIEWGRP